MTTTRRGLSKRYAAALSLALIAIAGLTACGDDEQTADQQGAMPGGASTSQQSPADGEKPAADPTAPDETKGTDDDNMSPTKCLVGTWLADNDQLGGLFRSAAAGTEGAGAISNPTGKVLVTFGAEGQYGIDYQGWTMRLSQDGVTIDLIREGKDTGKYEATDAGSVEWTEVAMGSVATMKSPAGTYAAPAQEPASTSGTFVCEQDVLKITAEGGTTAFGR